MIFYPLFHGFGRAELAHDLDAVDPFGLTPRAIVERVITAGATPDLDQGRATPFVSIGAIHEVTDGDGRTFLVAISRDAEIITVQELRAEQYKAP